MAGVSYDEDFFEWTAHTARLLRQGRLAEADIAHIAEEIEDMGKRDRRGVFNRLRVLIAHLLKWTIQPDRRSPSWKATIVEQRSRLDLIFQDSSSLRRYASDEQEDLYCRAVQLAALETGQREGFPGQCPWSLEQILVADFFPK